jgi:hypothetical protein
LIVACNVWKHEWIQEPIDQCIFIETTNIDANEYNYYHSISSNEHMIGFIVRLAIKLDLIVEYRSTVSGCWLTPSGQFYSYIMGITIASWWEDDTYFWCLGNITLEVSNGTRSDASGVRSQWLRPPTTPSTHLMWYEYQVQYFLSLKYTDFL